MQRTYISPVEDKYPDKVWFGESMLFRLWYPAKLVPPSRTAPGDKVDARILFVIINSLYSFWWDVVMDWNLTILTNPSSPGKKLWGLRKTIHFSSPQLYYTAIFLDFILRYISLVLELSSRPILPSLSILLLQLILPHPLYLYS
jgi:hypothetical protein